MNNKPDSPSGLQEWAEWCRQHLDFVGGEVLPDHPFEDFCNAIGFEALIFQSRYKTEKSKRERTVHRKREMQTLRNALAKARALDVFSGRMPDLFIHLLIKCCETECCFNYKKGTTPLAVCEAQFIAELATLLFKYTGRPFEYGSKSDLLCLSVVEIFKVLGLPHDPGGIRHRISNNILAIGSTMDNAMPNPATRPFSHSELKDHGATPANLPFGYTFTYARATFYGTLQEYKPRGKFEYSPLAREINNMPLPALPEDLLHPDLCLWLRYIAERLCVSGNDRDRLLCQLAAEHLDDKDLTTLYAPGGLLNPKAQKAFEEKGQLYSLQEVLGFIRSGVQVVFRNNKTGNELRVHAETIPGDGTSALIGMILELQDYVFDRFEPRLVDFIPMACPVSLDEHDDTPV